MHRDRFLYSHHHLHSEHCGNILWGHAIRRFFFFAKFDDHITHKQTPLHCYSLFSLIIIYPTVFSICRSKWRKSIILPAIRINKNNDTEFCLFFFHSKRLIFYKQGSWEKCIHIIPGVPMQIFNKKNLPENLTKRSDHYLSVGRLRQLSPYCDCDNQLNLNGFFWLFSGWMAGCLFVWISK